MNKKSANENKVSKKSSNKIKPQIPIEQATSPEELLQKIPPETREKVHELQVEATQTLISGIMGSASNILTLKFLEKCDKDQISQIITNTENNNIRVADEKKEINKFNLTVIIICAIFLIFGCIFFTLTKNQDILFKLIEFIVLFIGGIGFGSKFLRK